MKCIFLIVQPTRKNGVTKMAPANACWDDQLIACSSMNITGTCNGTTIFHVADGTPCQGSDPNVDYVRFFIHAYDDI